MQIKKHVPNAITLLNLFCGCIALVFVSKSQFEMAFGFVCLGIFFDFFDGFFARLFKVSGSLGLQLDSLADMVTSGVVPGYTMYSLLKNAQNPESSSLWVPYLGFIITLGSCYRLANFNIDTRQTDSFIGLPTPANTLFIMSLPLIIQFSNSLMLFDLLSNTPILLFITLGSASMLNAELPLFSLKIKDFSIKNNALPLVFLFLSLGLMLFLGYLSIPLIIILYVLLSLITHLVSRK